LTVINTGDPTYKNLTWQKQNWRIINLPHGSFIIFSGYSFDYNLSTLIVRVRYGLVGHPGGLGWMTFGKVVAWIT